MVVLVLLIRLFFLVLTRVPVPAARSRSRAPAPAARSRSRVPVPAARSRSRAPAV